MLLESAIYTCGPSNLNTSLHRAVVTIAADVILSVGALVGHCGLSRVCAPAGGNDDRWRVVHHRKLRHDSLQYS